MVVAAATAGLAYFNRAGFGVVREDSKQAQLDALNLAARNPTDYFENRLEESIAESRRQLSEALGVEPEQVALTSSTTESLSLAAASICRTLSPKDEVIVTDLDYGGVTQMWLYLAARHDLQLRKVELSSVSAENSVERLFEAISPRTKVLSVPHISSATSTVIPIEEICRRHDPERSHLLVDGAHGLGHLALDVSQYSRAFYCGCGHKWVGAPAGTGFLVMGSEVQVELVPLVFGWNALSPDWRRRIERIGTRDYSPWAGWPSALALSECELVSRSSVNRVAETAHERLEHLGIASVAHQGNYSSLMRTYVIPGKTGAAELKHVLGEAGVVACVIDPSPLFPDNCLMRLSFGLFNSMDEVDRLVSALSSLFRSANRN